MANSWRCSEKTPADTLDSLWFPEQTSYDVCPAKLILYDSPIWFAHYCSLNQPLGEVSQMWPEEHQIISFKLSKLPFSSMCCENRCEHLLDQGPSKITSEYQSAMQNSRSPHWSMQEMLLSWKKASVPCKSHARVLKPFRWSKGHLLSTLALPF